MSASYLKGDANFHCYNDCRQEGCPGHTIRVKEKHGGLIVMFMRKDGTVEEEAQLPFDYHLYYALKELLDRGWA